MSLWADIAHQVGEATGQPFHPVGQRAQGGGCINEAVALDGDDGRRIFVKLNRADRLEMFMAEADGLKEIAAAGTIRVPLPLAWGASTGQAWLALEYLDLGGTGDPARLGRLLADLHRTARPHFGWWRGNTLGSTPQDNTLADDWIEFWRARRLGHQLSLAARRGASRRLLDKGERLLAGLAAFFSGYAPVPSLLHGDLWGGNHGYAAGEPVIFDPAVYYGDRETDLAMTELFGGFPAGFYAAYREAWPLDPGYGTRRTLYNLYHILNHDHLFGGGYAVQAERMMDALLAEIGR